MQCSLVAVLEPGEPDNQTVASLLERTARTLRSLPTAVVRHLDLDTSDDTRSASVTLTVYYDGPQV